MKLTQVEINNEMNLLPENIKTAVENFDWSGEVMKIGGIHKLNLDQIQTFQHQTLLVILARTAAEDYEENLIKEMGVTREVADLLVEFANKHIFKELQKRAFAKKNTSLQKEEGPGEEAEEIEHEKLADIMRNEGIELVHHENIKTDSDLGQEVADILSQKLAEEGKEGPITEQSPSPEYFEEPPKEKKHETLQENYQEIIDSGDLIGVKNYHVNTPRPAMTANNEVLDLDVKTDSQMSLQKELEQTLDKQLVKNPFTAKGDTIDLSPSDEEPDLKDKKFLSKLSGTE